jgi:hypothetical protein
MQKIKVVEMKHERDHAREEVGKRGRDAKQREAKRERYLRNRII